MVLREALDNLSLLKITKLPIDKFIHNFSNILYIAGESLDHNVLNFITQINLSNIKRIIILTPYSNLDKKFTTSWGVLGKFLLEIPVDLEMKAPKERIPADIYFMDKDSIFFIPRNYFEKKIEVCCLSADKSKRDQIMNALASAEEFTTLRGHDIFHKKFNALFQIENRYLSEEEMDNILDSLISWETSGYDDIEPVWRIFESKIRNFIRIRLSGASPSDWFSTKVIPCFNHKPNIILAIMKLFDKNKNRLGITNIDEHSNPNEYLNAENYEQIINNTNNRSLFNDYRNISNRKYQDYIRDIIKARNAPIHSRTPDNDAEVYSNIIVKIIMSIEWLNKLESTLLQEY